MKIEKEEAIVNSNKTSVFDSKESKLNIQKTKIINQKSAIQFVYIVQFYCENEKDLSDIRVFNEYSIARKYVNNRIKIINNNVDKKMKDFSDKNKFYFTERYPDEWSNGNEWIKIIMKEVTMNKIK